jgi:hypothetical protein
MVFVDNGTGWEEVEGIRRSDTEGEEDILYGKKNQNKDQNPRKI